MLTLKLFFFSSLEEENIFALLFSRIQHLVSFVCGYHLVSDKEKMS